MMMGVLSLWGPGVRALVVEKTHRRRGTLVPHQPFGGGAICRAPPPLPFFASPLLSLLSASLFVGKLTVDVARPDGPLTSHVSSLLVVPFVEHHCRWRSSVLLWLLWLSLSPLLSSSLSVLLLLSVSSW
jgi:hypothetical protein